MNSKTPKFNAVISDILGALTPCVKVCRKCGLSFEIIAEDIEFLKLLEVPPPTLCPSCRLRRRRAFANYTTLYKRPCSVPGHPENIISQIPAQVPFPVYDSDYYWSDSWSPVDFGFKYSNEKSFLYQFRKLFIRTPQPQTTRDPMSVNSEYSSYGIQNKNCYYVFGGLNSESIMYSHWPAQAKDCIDCLVPWQCERCYEVVYSVNCYHCRYLWFCRNCMNCDFCYDCHSCESCFGCINLRNKKFYIYNEPHSQAEYEQKVKEIMVGSHRKTSETKHRFLDFLQSSPKRAVFNERNINCSGNFLDSCRDCKFGFFQRECEHCRYTDMNLKAKDCMDMCFGTSPSRCYEVTMPYDGSNIKFSVLLRNQCRDLEYCMNMKNCSDCFGCVGLASKKFCILNIQYSEEDYWLMIDQIKIQMLKNGEYGEMLGMDCSPFPYNASLSAISHERSESEIKAEGLSWIESVPQGSINENIRASELPDIITETESEIIQKAIECEKTKRLFRITPQELEFYQREKLPLPRLHPYERLINRLTWMGFQGLNKTKCLFCSAPTFMNSITSLAKNVVCESCHQKQYI